MKKKRISFKRIIYRVKEELTATKMIAKITGWRKAIVVLRAKFRIQKMNGNGFIETPKIRKLLTAKHDIMNDYFEKTYEFFLEKYDFDKIPVKTSDKFPNVIWMCWWQGIETAPIIVQKCVESIRKNAGECKIIILTEKNYKDYVELPDWIEDKKVKGTISRTHFSDLLRFYLLAKYGGMWLDATFFCIGSLKEFYDKEIWSIKRPDYLYCSVAKGYFANYSFKCSNEYRWVFAYIYDFLLYYWNTNEKLVDYLLTDYIITLIQRHNSKFSEVLATIEPNNFECDELYKVLDDIYDKNKWKKLQEKTKLFKLSWKYNFSTQKNYEDTFYGKLVNDELIKSDE